MTSIASKITDMHVCPMVTPGPVPVPHVGGPVLPPGVPTVLASTMPATPIANMCTCVGPPDVTLKGSATVLIQNRMWVRLGIDTTAHGGTIVGPGAPTIIVGG
ncbi:MAG: PAAR domain-containing protein [Pseudomonadota bacterium]